MSFYIVTMVSHDCYNLVPRPAPVSCDQTLDPHEKLKKIGTRQKILENPCSRLNVRTLGSTISRCSGREVEHMRTHVQVELRFLNMRRERE